MIMTVEEYRGFVQTDETEPMLALRLEAVERTIQGYTHNNFRKYMTAEGKIEYPADIKLGAINLLKWEMEMREKAGVASETISRHSVTYKSGDGKNTINGYPAELMGFLKPYMKAQFGQGLRA